MAFLAPLIQPLTTALAPIFGAGIGAGAGTSLGGQRFGFGLSPLGEQVVMGISQFGQQVTISAGQALAQITQPRMVMPAPARPRPRFVPRMMPPEPPISMMPPTPMRVTTVQMETDAQRRLRIRQELAMEARVRQMQRTMQAPTAPTPPRMRGGRQIPSAPTPMMPMVIAPSVFDVTPEFPLGPSGIISIGGGFIPQPTPMIPAPQPVPTMPAPMPAPMMPPPSQMPFPTDMPTVMPPPTMPPTTIPPPPEGMGMCRDPVTGAPRPCGAGEFPIIPPAGAGGGLGLLLLLLLLALTDRKKKKKTRLTIER